MNKKPIVFAYPGNEKLANSIAEYINADIGKMEIRSFPDGELYIRVLSEVKNRVSIIVCSLNKPNEKTFALYFLSKTLKSLESTEVWLVLPYLAYLRQDKIFHFGEALTSEYFASLISGFANKVFTIDPHLHRLNSLGEIYSIPTIILNSSSLIATYIRNTIKNPLLIGPDSESEQWLSQIAKNAGAPYVILNKTRLGDKEVEISLPVLENFKNHTPVLVDDIISTAETMIEVIEKIKHAGMTKPVCIGIHAVFSQNAFVNLEKSGVFSIVTCNTIDHKTNQIDVSELIGMALVKELG